MSVAINPKDPWARPSCEPTVLEEAATLVGGARAEEYGHPAEHWALVGRLWTAYLGTEVSALDACVLMVLLKQARLRHGYHHDSVVDTAGYARVQQLIGG